MKNILFILLFILIQFEVGYTTEIKVFNFTENVSSYSTNSFKSEVVQQIKFTKALGGDGLEHLFIVGNGTDSAIWMWDDKSEGYGVSNNELTFVVKLENFDNDTLTGSEIVFGTI
mgnify:CR=1 FL=1